MTLKARLRSTRAASETAEHYFFSEELLCKLHCAVQQCKAFASIMKVLQEL